MISQPPAYVGLPPIRTMRRSTGRMTGSVKARSVRPRALNGETRRERSNHEPSATRAATTTSPKTAYRTNGIGQLRAVGRGNDPLLLDLVRGRVSLGRTGSLGPRHVEERDAGRQDFADLGHHELSRAHVARLLLHPHDFFEIRIAPRVFADLRGG